MTQSVKHILLACEAPYCMIYARFAAQAKCCAYCICLDAGDSKQVESFLPAVRTSCQLWLISATVILRLPQGSIGLDVDYQF